MSTVESGVAVRVAFVARAEQAARAANLAEAVGVRVAIFDSLDETPDDVPIIVVDELRRDVPDCVAYFATPAVTDIMLKSLVRAVAADRVIARLSTRTIPASAAEAGIDDLAFAASRAVAGSKDLASTETATLTAILQLVDADRAYCYFFNTRDGSLWSETREHELRANRGIVGWVARTGFAVKLVNHRDEPLSFRDLDDPDGPGEARLLVQPVIGSDLKTQAVLVAARNPQRAEFGVPDAVLLERFASQCAPLFEQLSNQIVVENILDAARAAPIYRREAIEAATVPEWGNALQISPAWVRWIYWAMVVLVTGAVVFVSIARIGSYVRGPAILRSHSKYVIAAQTAGTIASVDVTANGFVDADARIAGFDDANERATVDRLSSEYATALRTRMLDPTDAEAGSSVRALRLQLELAEAALRARGIYASKRGVLSDIRVRPGDHVQAGDVVATIVEPGSTFDVIALLPGEARPRLSPGMKLRVELTGYRYSYQTLTIDEVSQEVLSPAEARRMMGPEGPEFALPGPVVVVRARTAGDTFVAAGRTLRLHDGMTSTSEVRLGSQTILHALFPIAGADD